MWKRVLLAGTDSAQIVILVISMFQQSAISYFNMKSVSFVRLEKKKKQMWIWLLLILSQATYQVRWEWQNNHTLLNTSSSNYM